MSLPISYTSYVPEIDFIKQLEKVSGSRKDHVEHLIYDEKAKFKPIMINNLMIKVSMIRHIGPGFNRMGEPELHKNYTFCFKNKSIGLNETFHDESSTLAQQKEFIRLLNDFVHQIFKKTLVSQQIKNAKEAEEMLEFILS